MLVEITTEDIALLQYAATTPLAIIDPLYGDIPELPLDPACWKDLKQFFRPGVVAIPNRFKKEVHFLAKSLWLRGDNWIVHRNDVRFTEQVHRLAARLGNSQQRNPPPRYCELCDDLECNRVALEEWPSRPRTRAQMTDEEFEEEAEREESEYTDSRDRDIWEAAPSPVDSDLKEEAI